MTSLKTQAEINQYPPLFIFEVTFANYLSLIESHDFFGFLLNSALVSVSSTIVVMLLGIPAAYALARYRVG